MGQSTDGTISFGVICADDWPLPWDREKFSYDIEEWWMHERGFVSTHEPFTADGFYAPGWSGNDVRLEEYRAQRRDWMEANPVPVHCENYCSDKFPMYVLVVPGISLTCHRGNPTIFDPTALTVSPEQIARLLAFVEEYDIAYSEGPCWLLTSYWG